MPCQQSNQLSRCIIQLTGRMFPVTLVAVNAEIPTLVLPSTLCRSNSACIVWKESSSPFHTSTVILCTVSSNSNSAVTSPFMYVLVLALRPTSVLNPSLLLVQPASFDVTIVVVKEFSFKSLRSFSVIGPSGTILTCGYPIPSYLSKQRSFRLLVHSVISKIISC